MNVTKETLVEHFSKLHKANFDVEVEALHVMELLSIPKIKEILDNFEFTRFINAGGSGLVFEVCDSIAQMPRALKLSRKNAVDALPDENSVVNVDLEIRALAVVSHQNITRFYAGAKADNGHYAIITELVEGESVEGVGSKAPLSIDEWVISKISATPLGATAHLDQILLELASLLLGYVAGFRYMHERQQLFHMDVKPGNLLVDRYGVAYVTDLGFARSKKHYQDDAKVPVGFTFGYNHPQLIEGNLFRAPTTLARAQNIILGKDLDARYDLFAFGRTILRLLYLFQERFGERVVTNYTYRYLHLLATLLLGGRNSVVSHGAQPTQFVAEIASGIQDNLIHAFKLSSFTEVEDRLHRLIGRLDVQFLIPELNHWYPKQVNHGVGRLNVTPRIASLGGHPAARRLKQVLQLGLADDVYPGATHTRYAHSLGVTSKITEALLALYHDFENPIFKVLVSERDLRCVIATSVVHDIGQSEFGHEFEEIDEAVYSHKDVTKFILKCEDYVDISGRSIGAIISGKDYNEWDLSVDDLLGVLYNTPAYAHFRLFNELLDGPLDCDKMDYLLRDAKNTNVPYGLGVDIERLLSCVTVLPEEVGRHQRTLRLGVKEKGLASSEAIAFARRQMYQAVYLQHTARAMKAMVLTACAQAHFALVKALDLSPKSRKVSEADAEDVGELFQREPSPEEKEVIQTAYACYLTGLTPKWPAASQAKYGKLLAKLWKDISNGEKEALQERLELDRGIFFFSSFMNEKSKHLLSAVSNRSPYKRIWDIPLSLLTADQIDTFKTKLSWTKRQIFLGKIEIELKNRVTQVLKDKTAVAETLNLLPPELETIERRDRHILIVDFPFRPLGIGGNAPPVIRDIDRKSGEYAFTSGVGHIWREGMEKMMKEIIFVRVFCEPRFYEILTSALAQEEIESIISGHFDVVRPK